jgi:hypothetical protein
MPTEQRWRVGAEASARSARAGRDSGRDPISSTGQIPIPHALRKARLTARVSATRISVPRTTNATLDGSVSL